MYPNKLRMEALPERNSSKHVPKEIIQVTGRKIEPPKAQEAKGSLRG